MGTSVPVTPFPKQIMEYQDVQKMLENMAFSWQLKTGIDSREFFAEGNFSYVKASQGYNPVVGDFKPYLYSIAWSDMKAYADEFKLNPTIIGDIKYSAGNPESSAVLNDSLDKLSKEAKEIVRLALDCPKELIDMAKERYNYISRNLILNYLHKKKGWSKYSVENCFNEIKEVLK